MGRPLRGGLVSRDRVARLQEASSAAPTKTIAMPGRPSAKVRANLKEVDPGRRLCWHGNVGGDRVFAGTRELRIEPQPDGTVLVTHVEDVTGLLFPVFRAASGSAIQKHHANLNRALKARRRPHARGVPGRERKGTNALPLSTYTAVGDLRQDPVPPHSRTAEVGFSRGSTGEIGR